jgi:uncharacterized protein GlcG (DUF336 family)
MDPAAAAARAAGVGSRMMIAMKPAAVRRVAGALLSAILLAEHTAHATVIAVGNGTRRLNLRIGTGNTAINNTNATVDRVTMTVGGTSVGDGNAVNGAVSLSTCLTNGVTIQALARTPNGNSRTATLTVNSSTPLTSGTDTIPFTQIGWTSDGADIPSGTFTGSSAQVLATFTSSSGRSNCHQFRYLNTNVRSAGTYDGVVTYTLSMP